MGLFDFLKKKDDEPAYDPTNIKITDLDQGWIVEYDLKTWEVKEVFDYDWGNNNFTVEYKLDSGDEQIYLHIDDDDKLYLTVSKPVRVRSLDEDIPEDIEQRKRPPKKIHYQNITYYLDRDSAGYSKERTKSDDDWAELISWEYYDESEKNVINITQYDDFEFEASVGIMAETYEFSNILPPAR